MRLQIDALLDYSMEEPADVLLSVEAAELADQRIIEGSFDVKGTGPLRKVPGEDGVGNRIWARADGAFLATYRGIVEVERPAESLVGLAASARRDLPADVIPYLWPSRYCEADRFEAFVMREFAGLEAGDLVTAMAEWIYTKLAYCPGSSDATTTAVDCFVSRQGVCRDFAHLLASFARAAGIPARLVSAYAWKLDPPDFHAVVDVWLDGAWRLIDATRLSPREGMARIAVGRDATDIAFMTIFGCATLNRQTISVARVD